LPRFSLLGLVYDPEPDDSLRVSSSHYAGTTPEVGSDLVVFQRESLVGSGRECGAMEDYAFIEKRVGEMYLTVCSLDFAKDGPARTFWQNVEWTSDLEQVEWLRD